MGGCLAVDRRNFKSSPMPRPRPESANPALNRRQLLWRWLPRPVVDARYKHVPRWEDAQHTHPGGTPCLGR